MLRVYLQLLHRQRHVQIHLISEPIYLKVKQPGLGPGVHRFQFLLPCRLFPLELHLHLNFIQYAVDYLPECRGLFVLGPPLLGQPVVGVKGWKRGVTCRSHRQMSVALYAYRLRVQELLLIACTVRIRARNVQEVDWASESVAAQRSFLPVSSHNDSIILRILVVEFN